MTNVSAYLNFNGNCRDAMTFYKESFGGELMIQTVKETPVAAQCPEGMQDQIMHASLTGDGFVLMASDMIMGGDYQPGNNFSLTVNGSSEDHVRSLFDKLADGGQVVQPLQKQFWGALFGMLSDKFGTRWMFNYDGPTTA